MPTRCLAYCRVSSQGQEAHGTSLDVQREEITRYCAARGYPAPIFHVEIESGSGEKQEARVVQKALMADARKDDLIIVSKQDRWSRDTVHMLTTVGELLKRGAFFYSLAEGFDAATPSGELTMTVMAGVAKAERSRIRERSRGAVERLRAMGCVTQSRPTLGYLRDRVTRRFVLDPAWAPKMAQVFDLARTRSLRDIRRIVEADGVRMPSGDPAGIARKLANRTYLGETELPSGERIQTHPAIVDVETFDAVQRALSKRQQGGRNPAEESRSAHFLLRGVATCGRCGHVLRSEAARDSRWSAKTRPYYRCSYPVPTCGSALCARQDEVDPEAERRVLARLDELRETLATPVRKAAKGTDWTAARAKVLSARARVVDAIADGVMSHAAAREKIAECDASLARIEAEERAVVRPSPESRVRKLAEVDRVRHAWAMMSVSERRDVVRILTAKITISPKPGPRWSRAGWDLEMEWEPCAKRCG